LINTRSVIQIPQLRLFRTRPMLPRAAPVNLR
jgi:hypothetical protein